MDHIELERLRARLDEQERRLLAQEEELALLRRALPSGPGDDAAPTLAEPTTRRGMLRLLGAAAAGVAGAGVTAVAGAVPAGAATGDPLVVGKETSPSPGQAAATVLNVVQGGFRADSRSAFIVHDGQDPAALGAAIQGQATDTLVDGVAGVSLRGSAVVGYAPTIGYSLYAAGGGGIAIEPSAPTGPPLGDWTAGDLAATEDGALWANVGGPRLWRKLAGPTTAGAFHLLDPVRIFDTRIPEWNRKLRAGGSLVLGMQAGPVPPPSTGIPLDATAVTFNLTIDQTEGTGFVALHPSDIAWPGTSTINWSSGGLTLANGGVSRLGTGPAVLPFTGAGALPSVTVLVGGPGATHVILDVTGYFR